MIRFTDFPFTSTLAAIFFAGLNLSSFVGCQGQLNPDSAELATSQLHVASVKASVPSAVTNQSENSSPAEIGIGTCTVPQSGNSYSGNVNFCAGTFALFKGIKVVGPGRITGDQTVIFASDGAPADEVGIRIESSDVLIHGIEFKAWSTAIRTSFGGGANPTFNRLNISGNTFTDCAQAIDIRSSSNVKIRLNQITNTFRTAIKIAGVSGASGFGSNTVSGNIIVLNNGEPNATPSAIGIAIVANQGSVVAKNTISYVGCEAVLPQCGSTGIVLSEATNTTVRNNQLSNIGPVGIQVQGEANVVTGNKIDNLWARSFAGVGLQNVDAASPSVANVYTGNRVLGKTPAYSENPVYGYTDISFSVATSSNNIIAENHFERLAAGAWLFPVGNAPSAEADMFFRNNFIKTTTPIIEATNTMKFVDAMENHFSSWTGLLCDADGQGFCNNPFVWSVTGSTQNMDDKPFSAPW